MKINLTEEQKNNLERSHKSERDSRICDRIKAVLLANEGWTYKQIAQALRIHETTVWGHLSDYLHEEKLKPNGGGSKSKLNKQQTEELIAHLEENIYPSTKEIIAHVALMYGIIYTQQGMHDWLINHRFSYKKPSRIPLKFNEEKQKEFIEKYNELKANRKAHEIIIFMDSVHPTQETKVTCGWIRTGMDKPIATVASRARINLTGGINLDTMSVLTREYDSINGSSTVDFLQALKAANPTAKKIHVIADGGGAHTSQEVALFLGLPDAVNREYLKNNYDIELPGKKTEITKKTKEKLGEILKKEPLFFENKEILNSPKLTTEDLLNSLKKPPPRSEFVMHILPPYSPNLNPIERLWKVMNEQTRNNCVFKTFSEFKQKIHSFFNEKWNGICDEFKSRINDNFQTLKQAF
jgi:transposase